MEIPIVGIIVALLLLALVLWAVRKLVPALGLPPVVTTIVTVVAVVIFCLYLLQLLGLWGGAGTVSVG